MRIALTGTQRTGKSTLVQALVEASPNLSATIEPYYHLEKQGYRFSQPLSLDDFIKQLECSIHLLSQPTENIVFDRCPLDFLGYLVCHHDTNSFDFEEWIPRIQESMNTLGLLVHVPIEEPERIAVPLSLEERNSRRVVDQAIEQLLVSRVFRGRGHQLLKVKGTVKDRVQQVFATINRMRSSP